MEIFYVYLWLYYDGTVRYVGKGKDNRAYKASRNHYPPTDRSRIIIQYFTTEEDAFEAERFFIAYYGREDLGLGTLRNHSDGGEGVRGYSPEMIAASRERNLGKKMSEESKAKISAALMGRPGGMLGKKHSDGTRKLMSSRQTLDRRRAAAKARAKFTKSEIEKILTLRRAGWYQRELAEKFGVHKETIGLICRGRTYKLLQGDSNGRGSSSTSG